MEPAECIFSKGKTFLIDSEKLSEMIRASFLLLDIRSYVSSWGDVPSSA
jgi:hypothetical protein